MAYALETRNSGLSEARWIISENTNVERLLDVFTSHDPESEDVLCACRQYILHLIHHNPHETNLLSRIMELPDSHPWKAYYEPLFNQLHIKVLNEFARSVMKMDITIPLIYRALSTLNEAQPMNICAISLTLL